MLTLEVYVSTLKQKQTLVTFILRCNWPENTIQQSADWISERQKISDPTPIARTSIILQRNPQNDKRACIDIWQQPLSATTFVKYFQSKKPTRLSQHAFHIARCELRPRNRFCRTKQQMPKEDKCNQTQMSQKRCFMQASLHKTQDKNGNFLRKQTHNNWGHNSRHTWSHKPVDLLAVKRAATLSTIKHSLRYAGLILVPHLKRTPIFEWCVVRCGSKLTP